MFNPSTLIFNTPIKIQHRTVTLINGTPEVSWTDASPVLDYCNWKSKGGTESVQSGTIVVLDTAELVMWFRPDLVESDRILPEAYNAWQIKMDELAAAYEAEAEKEQPDAEVIAEIQSEIDIHESIRPAYEVVNIENIEMRNMYMIVKVKRYTGG